MVCWAETRWAKVKSKHTWYLKNKNVEKSTQMRDLAFHTTPPKKNPGKMIENKLKQDIINMTIYKFVFLNI